MTAIPAASQVAARRRAHVVVALARLEAGRMVRNPLLMLAVLACAWSVRTYGEPEPWRGMHYMEFPWPVMPLQLVTAVLVAIAFSRERQGVGSAVPVLETQRAQARLLAAVVPVGIALLAIAAMAARIWTLGGLELGDEPGYTSHAFPTVGELMQPVSGTLLAVAVGAAAGRRMRYLVTAIVALTTGYIIIHAYWLFSGPIAPFAVVQSQPVFIDLGPDVDPAALPEDWLLQAPTQFQANWARLAISEPLAWWHNGWLVGLTLLFLALAFPRSWRRQLAVAGAVVAVVSLVAQFAVYPAAAIS